MTIRKWALLGALLAAAVNGCSKTEDTAPETRIFGDPPVIQSVEFAGSQQVLHCDISNFVRVELCTAFGYPPNSYSFTGPTVTLNLTYTDILMKVRVADPNSTPTANDVLLVGASYVHDGKETTLLVFDDGSQLEFPQLQAVTEPTNCTADGFGANSDFCPLTCENDKYLLRSNDLTPADGEYSRGFAFATFQGPMASPTIDCFASILKRPAVSTEGVANLDIAFKIEAVDRSGNISTWPDSPSVLVQGSSIDCDGDDCICCLLSKSDPISECGGGIEGFVGVAGSGYEQGWCRAFIP